MSDSLTRLYALHSAHLLPNGLVTLPFKCFSTMAVDARQDRASGLAPAPSGVLEPLIVVNGELKASVNFGR